MRPRISIARIKSVQKFRYGWVPDVPDQRDLLYGAVCPAPLVLPQNVDLRPTCSPVENQSTLGSCTGNALAAAIEFLERKDNVPFVDASRLFIYYNERAIEGTVKSDSGAMIRDGIKTLKNQGVCSERNWPYIVSKYAIKPSAACYKEALKPTNHIVRSHSYDRRNADMSCRRFSVCVRVHCV